MWHVSLRSSVATLRTAIHLLLTYLLTYVFIGSVSGQAVLDNDGANRRERQSSRGVRGLLRRPGGEDRPVGRLRLQDSSGTGRRVRHQGRERAMERNGRRDCTPRKSQRVAAVIFI